LNRVSWRITILKTNPLRLRQCHRHRESG
jgi:hypothetical protein